MAERRREKCFLKLVRYDVRKRCAPEPELPKENVTSPGAHLSIY